MWYICNRKSLVKDFVILILILLCVISTKSDMISNNFDFDSERFMVGYMFHKHTFWGIILWDLFLMHLLIHYLEGR